MVNIRPTPVDLDTALTLLKVVNATLEAWRAGTQGWPSATTDNKFKEISDLGLKINVLSDSLVRRKRS